VFAKYYSGDQITENETSRACDTQQEKELYIEFWWKNLTERENLKELGMTNRMTLKHI